MPIVRRVLLLVALLSTGCSGANLPFGGAHSGAPGAWSAASPLTLPPVLLYVAGGSQSTRHPDIAVFNAQQKGSNVQPLYTIPPRGGGFYDLLAVDGKNDLYVMNDFPNGTQLDVFPPGKKTPEISCLLATPPSRLGMSIAGSTLYMTTDQYTIEEYSLPLHVAKSCPKPAKTLTDERAKLRGDFMFAAVATPQGSIFDDWQSAVGQGSQYLDEFPAGSENARRYAPLGLDAGYYMASDNRGNLVADVSVTSNGYGGKIALFRYGSHHPTLSHPISNGMYLGFAFGNHDTELFAAQDYPATVVGVYAYDPATGKVGKELRAYSSGIWRGAQSIAVFSRS